MPSSSVSPSPSRKLTGAERAEVIRRIYARDPVAYVRDVLGFWAWSKQRDILESVRDHPRTTVRACHGVGKSLALETLLPTPAGWTTMGEVQVGDRLIDERGKPTAVTYVSPTWLTSCSEVTFDDHTTIVASDDHRWSALAFKPRAAARGRGYVADWRDHWVLASMQTTASLAADLRHNGQTRWSIPTARPLDLPVAALPVDPYVLGAWLGDGKPDAARLYAHADDVPFMAGQLAAVGETTTVVVGRTCSEIRFGGARRFRDLGVLGAKHIPAVYLRASIPQRLALLQGVMDTDGSARGDGTASIDLCSERLAGGVAELIRSFGWKLNLRSGPATLDGRVVGTRWRMHFRPDLPVFRMPRKLARVTAASAQRCRQTHRLITGIASVPTVATRCVTVDSPSHLYLAGEAMVPTHNTAAAAQVALWFLRNRPNSRVITTAPTWSQVEQLLWREIRAAVGRANQHTVHPPFPPAQATKLELGDQWFAIGLSTNEPERFQGHHADHLLLICDEASGVDERIFEASEGFLTAEGAKVLLIGNPNRIGGQFYRSFTEEAQAWYRIHISAFDSPNMTGEQVPDHVARSLPKATWPQEMAAAWGAESAFYQVRVLGEFAQEGPDTIVSLAAVAASQARWGEAKAAGRLPSSAQERVVIGCDVARYGSDSTVVVERVGQRITILDRYVGKPTTETAARVAAAARAHPRPHVRVVVDDTGVGGGVTDQLRAMGWPVTAFNAGNTAHRPLLFPNRRSELWFEFAAQLEDLDIDADDQLAADLTAPKYRLDDLKNRRVVEAKDETRKRLGRSPDTADAVLLTVAVAPADDAPQPARVPSITSSLLDANSF